MTNSGMCGNFLAGNPGQGGRCRARARRVLPDPTEGITDPKISPGERSCGTVATSSIGRVRSAARLLSQSSLHPRAPRRRRPRLGRPRDIALTYSQHRCRKCRKYFNADTSEHRLPKATTPIVSCPGGAPGRGGRLTLSSGQLAFVARSPRVCSLRHHPKLGGGGGKKGGAADVDELSRLGPSGLLRVHRGR